MAHGAAHAAFVDDGNGERPDTIRIYREPKAKASPAVIGGVECLLYCWTDEEWQAIPDRDRPVAEAMRLPNRVRLLMRGVDDPLTI